MEKEENLELPPETTKEEVEQTPTPEEKESILPDSTDPLDKLSEEELRAEAKKYRAIAGRKDKKPEPKEVKKEEVPFLTKADFYRSNQVRGIELATTEDVSDTDDTKSKKAQIKDNLDIVKKYYVSRRGQDTPESVKKDLFTALAAAIAEEEIKVEKPDPSAEAQTIGAKGATVKSKPQVKEDTDPRFSKPKQIDEWYK